MTWVSDSVSKIRTVSNLDGERTASINLEGTVMAHSYNELGHLYQSVATPLMGPAVSLVYFYNSDGQQA
jgi:hypothetical protein